MSLVPATVNLTGSDRILQGATYSRQFALTVGGSPVDLSAWSGANKGVRCQFRQTVEAAAVVVSPTVAIASPPSGGIINFTISSTDTTSMTITGGVYDIEVFDNNPNPPLVERVVQGSWTLEKEVTR